MSQAGKITQAGGAAGPILTLTGNTGGVITPVAGNINVVGDGVTLSTAKNGAGTLLISLENTTATTLTTNDGAFHSFPPFSLAGTGEAVVVTGSVVGTRFDGGNVYTAICGGPFSFVARAEVGSGVALLSNEQFGGQFEDSSTGNAAYQIVASGGLDILIQVRGEAGQTWHWKVLFNFISL